jgi:hypothetical protein
VDLRRALIEVDDIVVGLKNRLTLAVQRVVKAQDRGTINDMAAMVSAIRAEIRPIEEQWGIVIRELGFSTLSPTPHTLEVTQLRLLCDEKLRIYDRLRREEGLSEHAAVALISGAVVAIAPAEAAPLGAVADSSPRRLPSGAPVAPSPVPPATSGDASTDEAGF